MFITLQYFIGTGKFCEHQKKLGHIAVVGKGGGNIDSPLMYNIAHRRIYDNEKKKKK